MKHRLAYRHVASFKGKKAEEAKPDVEKVLGLPRSPWQHVCDPGVRSYGSSLAQDNYWCVPLDELVWWFIEGNAWTSDDLVAALKACSERLLDQACRDAHPRSRRAHRGKDSGAELHDSQRFHRWRRPCPRSASERDARGHRADNRRQEGQAAQRPAGRDLALRSSVRTPPGRERRRAPANQPDCHLMQFALTWKVAPDKRALVRLTSRFRGAVLRELLRLKTGDASATWTRVSQDTREEVADMVTKDANGKPLQGHRHTEFMASCENGRPTRLVVWRDQRAVDEQKQDAILLAAAGNVSWAAGPDAEEWRVRLVPLDRAVPLPPGFDCAAALSWESATPYVPSRHHLRGSKLRERESIPAQVRRELALRGFAAAAGDGEVEQIDAGAWVSVHVPRRDASKRAFIGDGRGYRLRLTFPKPVQGPVRLGHSSSFGLRLFRPVIPNAGALTTQRGNVSCPAFPGDFLT